MRKLPSVAVPMHEEEKDHDDAVHGEHLVIGVGAIRSACGVSSSRRMSPARGATDKEEECQRNEIKDPQSVMSP